MQEKVVGLRERTRLAVQQELFMVAMDLFLSQGYEATTVEQIADAAGMSRRSFFRYFASKDDVVSRVHGDFGVTIGEELVTRPRAERPWLALRRSFDPLVNRMSDDERMLVITRLMLESPALAAAHAQKQLDWNAAIATALAARIPGEITAIRATALAGAAIACLMAAQTEWVAHNGQTSLNALVDEAMASVSPLDAQ